MWTFSPRMIIVTVMILLAGSVAARVEPAISNAAPTRCDPAGFKPEAGKPLLYLYVWSGVANTVGASASPAPQPNDFVATIDVTEGSPCFGQIISEADVPTSGNEPHHVGLNAAGSVLGVGGFDSWRYDQPSLYFFDVATDPARPRYLTSVTPTEGAVADDLVRLPQASGGGFLVSLMGNKQGGTPGRVAELDSNLNLVAEHPKSGLNMENFNPHGLALTPPSINRMVTLDYVEYASTFKPSEDIKYRTTVRIWDQAQREILQVLDLGPNANGMMTVRYIPNVGNMALFFTSAGLGRLWLVDALMNTTTEVYDIGVSGHCVMTVPFKSASRIMISSYDADEVRLLDMSNPSSLQDMQIYKMPKGTGPHATVVAPGERLVAVSNYYVKHNRGTGRAAPFIDNTEKSIRLFSVAADGNSFTPHPQVPVIDFKNEFPHKGIAQPHGMAFKAVTAV